MRGLTGLSDNDFQDPVASGLRDSHGDVAGRVSG